MMITSFLFTSLVLTVSASSWSYVNQNKGAYIPAPFPNAQLKYKLRSEQTCNQVTTMEVDVLQGGAGAHMHTKVDELFTILEGQMQFAINGTQFCAKAGDYVYIPRFHSQAFRVHNPKFVKKPVRFELLIFPATVEGFFDEMAIYIIQGQNNSTIAGEISKKYGLVYPEAVVWEDIGCFEHNDD